MTEDYAQKQNRNHSFQWKISMVVILWSWPHVDGKCSVHRASRVDCRLHEDEHEAQTMNSKRESDGHLSLACAKSCRAMRSIKQLFIVKITQKYYCVLYIWIPKKPVQGIQNTQTVLCTQYFRKATEPNVVPKLKHNVDFPFVSGCHSIHLVHFCDSSWKDFVKYSVEKVFGLLNLFYNLLTQTKIV